MNLQFEAYMGEFPKVRHQRKSVLEPLLEAVIKANQAKPDAKGNRPSIRVAKMERNQITSFVSLARRRGTPVQYATASDGSIHFRVAPPEQPEAKATKK